MSYELPDIIFTVNLEPSIDILENGNLIRHVNIDDLEIDLQNTIKERISIDYKSIISNTLSPHYQIAAYRYDKTTNSVSIDFILTPQDIKKKWIPEGNNKGFPDGRNELLSTTRDDIIDQISLLYGDIAHDTWKNSKRTFFKDKETGLRYLIDLELISSESFLDWSNVGNQFRTTQVGGSQSKNIYYKKYMNFKFEYQTLKKQFKH